MKGFLEGRRCDTTAYDAKIVPGAMSGAVSENLAWSAPIEKGPKGRKYAYEELLGRSECLLKYKDRLQLA